jgi:hypothetical protein
VLTLLAQLTLDRVLLVVFVAGTLFERLKGVLRSQRSQGERIGSLEDRVTALEASRSRG